MSGAREFSLSSADLAILESYSYPGNVRELQNIIERAIVVARSDRLNFTMPEIFSRIVPTVKDRQISLDDAEAIVKSYPGLKDLERQCVTETLKKTNYKIYGDAGAAAILGIKPTTLISRIKAM